jgi:16S rRNA processing protein RimM
MELWSDFPERLQVNSTLYVGEKHHSMRLSSIRRHQDHLIVAFEGIASPEEAGIWRNHWVYVSTATRPPLPEGEYYHHQLIGLLIESDTGEDLGRVVEILETGSNDVLVVRPETGEEILLPITDEVVKEIDLETGKIRVHVLPGLRP